jgi:hypothetical protein
MNVLSTSLRRKFLILALAIELILWNPFCSKINTASLLARERVAENSELLTTNCIRIYFNLSFGELTWEKNLKSFPTKSERTVLYMISLCHGAEKIRSPVFVE